ncbi:hypothetical protein SE17_24600 [Kouleothrix aurantiaca]|jgi:hypothetical protein|uniref:Uncharacterized protein n=1 Tax=Kouleothrix aurantiaca TaxID=186479 RepID=A0A0P9F2T4_9CHLR|nr:hypothetical protein SE17_24600 [Kouleothrix aurantiaca]
MITPTQIQLIKVLEEERLQEAANRRRYGRPESVFTSLFARLGSALKAQPSQPARVAPAATRKAHS